MVINDWITVSPDSGCNNGEVILTIKKNNTTSQREYTVPIYLSDGSVKYIDVVQPACSTEPGEINIPEAIYFSYMAGDTETISIDGKGIFEVTSYPDYIRLTKLSGGTSTGSYSTSIGAETTQDNNTNMIKEGTITFQTTGVKKDLAVKQYRNRAAVDVKNDGTKGGYIRVYTYTPSSSTTHDYDITQTDYNPKLYNNGWTLYENYYGQVNRIGIITSGETKEILIDLANFDGVVNLIETSYMFEGKSYMSKLTLKNFNTSNVLHMNKMFSNCSGLTSLDLSSFDTSNVTNMSGMFNNCRSLTSLDLSNFNTEKNTDTGSMFSGCSGLTAVKVTNCNTATQEMILNRLKSDLSSYTWTLSGGIITRS